MQTDRIIHASPSAEHVILISLLHQLDDYLAVRDYLGATSIRSAIWWAASTFPVWDLHVQLKQICHGGPEQRASPPSAHNHGDDACNIGSLTSWDGTVINAAHHHKAGAEMQSAGS